MNSAPQKLIDRFGWLKCCYCGGVASTPAKLVAHIVKEHGAAGYQCPHCFFRAASQVKGTVLSNPSTIIFLHDIKPFKPQVLVGCVLLTSLYIYGWKPFVI